METVRKTHVDRQATQENIYRLAKKQGMDRRELKKAYADAKVWYRRAAKKSRLMSVERYFILSQIIGVRLDDLVVIAEDSLIPTDKPVGLPKTKKG